MNLLMWYSSRGWSLSGEQTVIFLAVIMVIGCIFYKISSKRTEKLKEEFEQIKEDYRKKGLEYIDPYGAIVYSGLSNSEIEYDAYLIVFRDRLMFEISKEKTEILFKHVKECRNITLKEARERGFLSLSDISEEDEEKMIVYLKLEFDKRLLFQVDMQAGEEFFYDDLCKLINENNPSALVVERFKEE